MSNNPQIYHGEWWVPAPLDRDLCSTFLEEPKKLMGLETKYKGTLTYYEDKESTLELYLYPSNFHAKHYCQNDVMWGQDANGNIFTLFSVTMKERPGVDFTNTKFVVAYILIGEHVLSANDVRYGSCIVQFPYLRNWAFHDNITSSKAGTIVSYKTPVKAEKLLETLHEDDAFWRIWQHQTIHRTTYDLSITQTTMFEIEAVKDFSIWSYLKHIEEFAQFLSIALYCDQYTEKIIFINKENKQKSIFLYRKSVSVDPKALSLIKFGILKEKLPLMLNTWHKNFKNIAPISSYLIESLQKNKKRFDVPDFLIIAQALDGYHKRFVNKKDGKDIRKYEDQIKILLNQFKDVKAIEKCHIKPEVLTDSRNYYSHLFPNEETKSAVEGDDLYWLTEKCKILLTCCILDMLGLTNKEINLCCENSPISQIIDSLPPEFD